MTTKHTPGPWSLKIEEGDGKCQYVGKCRTFTIESESRGHMFTAQAWKFEDDPRVFEEVEANVRLATTSPELLEELKHAVRWFYQLTADDAKRYQEVIDKAEGREQ